MHLTGLAGSAGALELARVLLEGEGPALVVTPSEERADRFAADLTFFIEGAYGAAPPQAPWVVRLPAHEVLPYDALSPDRHTIHSRLAALFRLHDQSGAVALVVSAVGLMRRVIPRAVLSAHCKVIEVESDLDPGTFAQELVLAGYQNVPLVEDPGTFAVRGGIVDLFPPMYEQPVRIDLFGDMVETIRSFDPESQRTAKEQPHVWVSPARETLYTKENIRRAVQAARDLAAEVDRPSRQLRSIIDEIERGASGFGVEALLPGFYEGGLSPLAEYLDGFTLGFVDDPLAVDSALTGLWSRLGPEWEAARARQELAFDPASHYLDPEQALAPLDGCKRLERHELHLHEADAEILAYDVRPTAHLRKRITEHHGEAGALTPLVEQLESWREQGLTSVLACVTIGQADRIKRMLQDRNLSVHVADGPVDLRDPREANQGALVHLVVGDVGEGFVDPAAGLALITDTDVLGQHTTRRTSRRRPASQASAARFRELSEGDYVIHVEHGIGRYAGLQHLELRGVAGDFVQIEYAGKDKVYLPVHRLGMVQKYVGDKDAKVRLDRLGSTAFVTRKAKVKEELLKMAAELLDIYAARKAHPGTAFSPPDRYFRQFEADFPYEETRDQARAIDEVLDDMQRPAPMDRLVCGDVGFGKTEVAMRAAMLAVLDGKQVAILVPTTVLAAQHERTFRERFKGYPVVIESMSRFKTTRQLRDVAGRLKAGSIDVLIGTHRILGRDVQFKDLGLLVIDEEQRFGVKQKESLKKMRRQVDVLTLTATPIPRTLHMSMSGVRDLSIIVSPPVDRRAIRTFVSRFDASIIRESVEREIARGGQVFYVHNRVQSIEGVRRYLSEVLPKARIELAHGQMHEGELERAMTRFVDREADVLLCTAIIESGLDIPSVNTIIVNRADMFGLAQLYQLRGRVGRSRERAYCYLLVPARRQISRDAKKRLAVLQQLTDLGSGFRLASHDMEIRGAGSLLGAKQSGQISLVGFDLYSQMLEDAVRELKGEPPREEVEPEVTLPVAAFLPERYIPEVHQRLGLYKRLASARSLDELDELRAELVDRYGELPPEAENHLRVMRIQQGLATLRLRSIASGPGRLVLHLGDDARLDPARLTGLVARNGRRMRLTPELKLVVRIDPQTADTGFLDAADAVLGELAEGAGEAGPGQDAVV